jgi:hypothetical protein
MMCLDLPIFNFPKMLRKKKEKKSPKTHGFVVFSGHKSPASVGVIAKTVLLGKGGVTVTNLVGL